MYEFWIDGVLIGHSKLERGDAPMGVAFGQFLPTDGFENLRSRAEVLDSDSRRWEGLSVKTPSGHELECFAGAVIIEYGPLDDVFAIEATCLGIGYPLYEELFPHHVKTYKEQWGN
ncbi:MAG: hypothetical protein COB92_06900 [Robiginitomaculum sp.]|nr:MAG: hypothetical protein COB92_06900 [Robiginitomaculum sp.]